MARQLLALLFGGGFACLAFRRFLISRTSSPFSPVPDIWQFAAGMIAVAVILGVVAGIYPVVLMTWTFRVFLAILQRRDMRCHGINGRLFCDYRFARFNRAIRFLKNPPDF